MKKFLRKIAYGLEVLFRSRRMPEPSDEPIDLLMPLCEKDLAILPLALEGVRRQVQHPIAAIYIIAAPSERVEAFCRAHGCRFVDERTVLGYDASSIGLRVRVCGAEGEQERDRSGWIFQQLLKLSGRIGGSRWFLTLDADHLLLRPHTFLTRDGRTVFYGSREYHRPYYDNIERLMGFRPDTRLSYVAHKMLFSREELARLRAAIEARTGEAWDRAILSSLDRTQLSGFSEFELYGNWLGAERKLILPWRAHSLTPDALADYETLRRRYSRWYAAITFPDYRKRRRGRGSRG